MGWGAGGGGRDHKGGRQSGVGMMLLIPTKAVSPSQGGKTQRFPAPILQAREPLLSRKPEKLESNSPVPGEQEDKSCSQKKVQRPGLVPSVRY